MSVTQFASNLLAFLLVTIMLGIGLTISVADLKRIVQEPKATFVGLFCQSILLPALAFLVCFLSPLPSEFKIGLILLAASPGGPSSNLYSFLAGGDVALNLTLTAINSFVSLITMPMYVSLALWAFRSGGEFSGFMGIGKMSEIFLYVVIPAAFGMYLKDQMENKAVRLSKFLKGFSALSLALTVTLIVYANWQILAENSVSAGWAVLFFNILSLAVGYWASRISALSRKQAIAISFEIGVHNASLALFLAINVLKKPAYAVMPSLYGIIMYVSASMMCIYLRRSLPKST